VRRIPVFALAGLAVLLWLSGARSCQPPTPPSEGETCGQFGTSVHFEKTPSIAAKKALKEEKLVMVLHVSGHFEDPEFT
jgi:hypothetical protein